MLFPESTPLIINGSLIWNNPVTSRRVIEFALLTAATAYPTDPLNLPFTWEWIPVEKLFAVVKAV